ETTQRRRAVRIPTGASRNQIRAVGRAVPRRATGSRADLGPRARAGPSRFHRGGGATGRRLADPPARSRGARRSGATSAAWCELRCARRARDLLLVAGMMETVRGLARSRLAQFFAIGSAIFLIAPRPRDDRRIEVSRRELAIVDSAEGARRRAKGLA